MILGHDLQKEIIKSTLDGMNHHALLLCGPKGIGKFGLSKELSIDILKSNSSLPEKIVEQQCLAGSYPNYVYVSSLTDDNGKQKADISVEQVRNLLSSLRKKSALPGLRVVIIDSIDILNIQASNALLKMLEEPPLDVVFILICHQVSSVLATIRSRCLRVDFSALPDKCIKEILEVMAHEVIEELIPYSMGSVGFYLELFNCGGKNVIKTISELITNKNINDIKVKAQEMLKASQASDEFYLNILHRMLYLKSLKIPALSQATQVVERFLRKTKNTHLDAAHRITAAILIAQNPNNSELLNV